MSTHLPLVGLGAGHRPGLEVDDDRAAAQRANRGQRRPMRSWSHTFRRRAIIGTTDRRPAGGRR